MDKVCRLICFWGLAGCSTAAFQLNEDGGEPDALPPADAGDSDMIAESRPCDVTFQFIGAAQSVQVRGEWNDFADPGLTLAADGKGGFSGSVALPPGLAAYKLVVNGVWQLDPQAALRKYVGGDENSAVRVANCHAPSLALTDKSLSRASVGHFTATVAFVADVEGDALDPASLKATLRKDAVEQAAGVTLAANGAIIVDADSLADGKYALFVSANDLRGHATPPLRLVFWVDATPFDWRDSLIYMVMTDRFRDATASNNAAPHPGVQASVDFQGGDLDGVRAAIADGTFAALGVNVLWLSPFHQNPDGPYKASDGVHDVMGYHGYWPVKARAVEPRIGGDAALLALVKEAHAHGIRVLADFVINHVHQDHEYFKAHPGWFRTGCVCGTAGCDWTQKRLECLFEEYLPDVNWTVPAVSEQYGDDMVWWIDHFDLDGLRLDAVKHVEDIAVLNLTARVRAEFEAAGTRVFLTGETAMGWSDCGLACNADQYGTIAHYIGPRGLDGQADFVLYHAAPYRVFAGDEKGMIHLDYWTGESQLQYPVGAIMTPYIGSHDTSRFVTLSSYRGQDGTHGADIPSHQWTDLALAPPDGEPYARHRLALSWLLTLPGAPLLYYGDEYGQWGGGDPNNRSMWHTALSPDEQATLTRTRALGLARRELTALRHGTYQSLGATEDTLAYARVAGADVAIVALLRAATSQSLNITLPANLGLANGAVLHDRLGGPDVTVQAGAISVPLTSRGAAILAP